MKYHLIFVIVLCSITGLYAQLGSLKVIGGGLNTGVELDMVRNLDASYFDDMSSSDYSVILNDRNAGMLSASSMICENMHYRAELILAPLTAMHSEIRLSASYVPGRIDMISYWDEDHYFNISSYQDEVSVGVSYLKHATLFGVLRAYGGLGTNVGYIFNHDLYAYGAGDLSADDMGILNTGSDAPRPLVTAFDEFGYHSERGPNGITQRVFLKASLAIRVADRVELALNGNYGVGYRLHGGGSSAMTNLHGFGLSLYYKTR